MAYYDGVPLLSVDEKEPTEVKSLPPQQQPFHGALAVPDYVLDFTKEVEGYRQYLYDPPEAGTDRAIGYGHTMKDPANWAVYEKRTDDTGKEIGGISKEEAETLLRQDLKAAYKRASIGVEKIYDPKGLKTKTGGTKTWENLPEHYKWALTDYAFNVKKNKKGKGGVEAYPKFTKALISYAQTGQQADLDKARAEYKRNYTPDDGIRMPLPRNKEYYKTFLQ